MSPVDITIIVSYFLLMLALGWYASRQQQSVEDYYVAGGRLGRFSIACVWFASWIGGAAVVGVADKAYELGISGVWYVAAMAIGCLAFGLFFAARVKRLGTQHNLLTYPDLIELRYDSRTRIVATVTTVLAFIAYAAGQLAAAAGILHTLLGIDYGTALLLSGTVIVLYTATGGYLAITYTDWVQVILLFVGIVLIGVPIAISQGGDWTAMNNTLPASHFELGNWGWGAIAALVVSLSLSFFTAMDSYTRMFAAKDERTAKQGTLLTVALLLPIAIGATWLGMAAATLFPGLENNSDVLTTFIVQTFPIGLKGLVLVGLLAALMSTADICILTASANLTRDVYQRYINPEVKPDRLLRISMLTSLAVGVLAALMAWQLQDVVSILLLGFTINSAALFIPSLAMVYFSKWNSNAAFWSISLSLLVVVIWSIATRFDGFPLGHIDALWPGLMVSFVVFGLLNRNSPTAAVL
ncbi:MAG: sodium:solute symporter [Pseudomonadales bacterium]